MADDNYDDSNDSDDSHLSPFLKVLRNAIETQGPEDGLELLRDLFTACGATAAMNPVVRADPSVAMEIMQEVLTAAIIAHNSVKAMRTMAQDDGSDVIIWMNNRVVGDA
jgi:hypothetical protein